MLCSAIASAICRSVTRRASSSFSRSWSPSPTSRTSVDIRAASTAPASTSV
ncbi:hypothetical protein [Microbacterium elymi]|uniref:Uncharacterized protein n=1 Tax=Microbacterium elymi TaxID=2909587 RepID=A0ABY5NNL7_9MICO|nr:hypothetical protein [Microbacterium elymi]UUT36752.1 hypothetical protein L2X98_33660 [Microbacterium elymi]